MKLTQNQRAVLASACENEMGVATRPSDLKAWHADKTASALITKGFVKEVRAKGDAPIWRKDEEGRDYALKILKAGREAVTSRTVGEKAAAATLTKEKAFPRATARSNAARQSPRNEGPRSRSIADVAFRSPRAGSKQALVVAMLREKGGATLEDLVSATGWLPHTTRAALTGLRKKGFQVGCERREGSSSLYRITEESSEAAA